MVEKTFNLDERDFQKYLCKENGLLTQEEINSLLLVPFPCLAIVKPHASSNETLINAIESLSSNLGLNILVKRRMNFTREQIFDIYGDLIEVMNQGEEGVSFVENLVDSFVNNGEGVVIIFYGENSYSKMRAVKALVREVVAEDRFRNVLHTSDNLHKTIREIAALM